MIVFILIIVFFYLIGFLFFRNIITPKYDPDDVKVYVSDEVENKEKKERIDLERFGKFSAVIVSLALLFWLLG